MSPFFRLVFVLLVASSTVASATRRIALVPVATGESVTPAQASTFGEAIAVEVRRLPDISLVSPDEVKNVLQLQQQRMALDACTGDACDLNLGKTLGADLLLASSLGRLGESWLVTMKLVDVKEAKAVAQTDRRLKGGTLDDVLDVLPKLVSELFGSAPAQKPEGPAATVTVKPGGEDVPADVGDRSRFTLLTDGKGKYLAFDPKAGSFDPFYAGDATKLYAQRVSGGSRNGDAFDNVIWEPRVKDRWMAGFGFKDGKYAIQCGNNSIPFTVVPAADAKKLVAAAQFLTPRWKRHLYAIARDDMGRYFVADQAREPEDNTDFRLFSGKKNAFTPVALDDVLVDGGEAVFISGQQRLRIDFGKNEGDWSDGGRKAPVKVLNVENEAGNAYGPLGVYKGETLGTICDGRL